MIRGRWGELPVGARSLRADPCDHWRMSMDVAISFLMGLVVAGAGAALLLLAVAEGARREVNVVQLVDASLLGDVEPRLHR